MTKNKAISVLKNQIEKLNKLPFENTSNWITQTSTYIDLFFGIDSHQHSYFHYYGEIKSEQKKKQLEDFLTDCIEIISINGLHKKPIDNWFSKLPNWAINLGLPALCFVSFGIGILFTNNNNYNLRKENSELKEQLLLISSDTIIYNDKNMRDKSKMEKIKTNP